MQLSPNVLAEIGYLVRRSDLGRDRIAEIVCEEMHEPGTIDPELVDTEVARAFASLREERKSWPARTDCDKLDAVFEALETQGIVTRQIAGYTQSDGYSDVMEDARRRPATDPAIGYCFFHEQDLERAVRGLGLFLAFGPVDPKQEDTEGVRVGELIARALRSQGFEVRWDGTFAERILLPQFDWKRR